MILVDFSTITHQHVFGAISIVKPIQDKNGKYKTSDYINCTKFMIIQDLINYSTLYKSYGSLVICLDCHSSQNWRKKILNEYKSNRNAKRATSPIIWSDVYAEMDELVQTLNKYTTFNILEVEHAEADDIILCLAEYTAQKHEETIIISTDKDLIQAQRNGLVRQYSPCAKKMVSATDKDQNMDAWLKDHVYLGDAADEVPSVFKNLVFTNDFITYCEQNNIHVKVEDFDADSTLAEKYSTLYTGEIFKKLRIGAARLKKLFECNDPILQNPIVLARLERNRKLVLQEYIPNEIRETVKSKFSELYKAKLYNKIEFVDYLSKNGCEALAFEANAAFSKPGIISIDDFF